MSSLLDEYTINYSQRMRNNPSPIIGRQKEIDEVINALLRATKNAPLLVGDPGVGKTAIVEGVAQAINDSRVPHRLRGFEILALDIARMTGENFERDFAMLIQEITQENQHYILFIDEFHMIMGTGSHQGTMDAANILKPALARGDFKLIGATTTDEFHEFLEADGALERRISQIRVSEPTTDETIAIMSGVVSKKLQPAHRVTYEDAAIEEAVKLSNRYMTAKFQPDKSYDLLDSAGARTERLSKTIVSVSDIQKELEELVGIPSGALQRSKFDRLKFLNHQLTNRVIGQPVANDAVLKVIKRALTGLNRQGRPLGSLLFVGPTGVGKTEMVKQVAKTMFDDEKNILRYDMTEFSQSGTVERFKVLLTRQVKVNPYTIILLDEIEKAHSLIFDLFLQVLDDGVLTDEFGRRVSFKNTYVIATSNMGYELMTDSRNTLGTGISDSVDADRLEELSKDFDFVKKTMKEELKRKFRPEFLNRLDDIVIFNFLGLETIRHIAELTVKEAIQTFKNVYPDISVSYETKVIDYIVNKGFSPNEGARPIQRTVNTTLNDKLSDVILNFSDETGYMPIKRIKFVLDGDNPIGFDDNRRLVAKITQE